MKRWEDRNQEDLQKLVALLTRLKNIVMNQKGSVRGAILVREDPRGPAILYEMLDKRNIVRREFFESNQPRGPVRQHPSGGFANAPASPQAHPDGPKTESKGGARQRGRGHGSKRGRGGAEQGGG